MGQFENHFIIWLSVSSLMSLSSWCGGEYIIRGPKFSPSTEAEIEGETIDRSIIALAEKKRRINDTFIIDAITNATLGWNEFIEKSRRLAAALQELGCSTGCMVGIVSENRVEYPIVYLGTWLAGATSSNFDPHSSADELIKLYEITKPTVIFCTTTHCDRIRPRCSRCSFIAFDTPDGTTNVSQFSTLITDVKKTYEPVNIDPDHTASILHSSGTTGSPKAIQLSHKGLVYLSKLFHENETPKNEGGTMISDRGLCHGMGLVIFLTAIVRNQTMVIMPRAGDQQHDYELYFQIIEKYRVNTLITTPTTIIFILKDERAKKYELPSLEYIVSSAAPLSPELEEEVKKRLKNLKGVIQWYGTTESMLNMTKNVDNPKSGTVGSANPLMQIKVVDLNTGKSLGSYAHGEIWIRGPTITKGYYGQPERTAKAIDQNGWYHSGDIGYFDDDEDFFIVGRMQDFIKYQSYQVESGYIEGIVLKHPAVLECAVIGIPDELNTEIPRGYIVKKPGEEVTEDDIINFVEENAISYAWLRGGVKFVPEIPKTGTGKILRRELSERFANGEE